MMSNRANGVIESFFANSTSHRGNVVKKMVKNVVGAVVTAQADGAAFLSASALECDVSGHESKYFR